MILTQPEQGVGGAGRGRGTDTPRAKSATSTIYKNKWILIEVINGKVCEFLPYTVLIHESTLLHKDFSLKMSNEHLNFEFTMQVISPLSLFINTLFLTQKKRLLVLIWTLKSNRSVDSIYIFISNYILSYKQCLADIFETKISIKDTIYSHLPELIGKHKHHQVHNTANLKKGCLKFQNLWVIKRFWRFKMSDGFFIFI